MKQIKVLLFCFFIFSFFCEIKAQENVYVKKDFDFVSYLIGNNMKEEALTLVNRKSNNYLNDILTRDSVNFLKGWTFYSVKRLNDAVVYFDSVTNKSNLYSQAIFFSALSSSHLKDYDKAQKTLNSFSDSVGKYKEFYSYEKAGLSLLMRNYKQYDYYKNNFTFSSYNFVNGEKELDTIYKNLISYKKKSYFMAGFLSSILPGLGKIYVGKVGEGLSSFLCVGSLGAITTENWIKNGFWNWKTILFGTIGTIFYIGNIYGSIISVKIAYEDFNNKQDIAILYNIHFPLRSYFCK